MSVNFLFIHIDSWVFCAEIERLPQLDVPNHYSIVGCVSSDIYPINWDLLGLSSFNFQHLNWFFFIIACSHDNSLWYLFFPHWNNFVSFNVSFALLAVSFSFSAFVYWVWILSALCVCVFKTIKILSGCISFLKITCLPIHYCQFCMTWPAPGLVGEGRGQELSSSSS